MDIRERIKDRLKKGCKTLAERESKQLLETYGVPVVAETVARDSTDAVHRAKEIGFPVVVKGLGADLLHKTEQGLVHLNLQNENAVARA